MASTDTNYRYSGPLSGVTLEGGREVMLHPGAEISLPADNDYVRRLVARNLLTEVPAAAGEIPPDPPLSKGGVKTKEVTDAG